MTDVAGVTVDALATYRLTRLLQRDTIPPLPALRRRFLARYGARPAGELVDCPWCLSIWVGLLVALARRVSPRLWSLVASVLATSAVTGITAEALDAVQPTQLEPVLRVVDERKG